MPKSTPKKFLLRNQILPVFGPSLEISDDQGKRYAFVRRQHLRLHQDIRVMSAVYPQPELLRIQASGKLQSCPTFEVFESAYGITLGVWKCKCGAACREKWTVEDAGRNHVACLRENSNALALTGRFLLGRWLPRRFSLDVDDRKQEIFRQVCNAFVFKLQIFIPPGCQFPFQLLLAGAVLVACRSGVVAAAGKK